MTRSAAALTAITLAFGVIGGTVPLADAADTGAPAIICEDLSRADFSHVPDASSVISSAAVVMSNGHEYCDVHAVIGLQTHAEIKLPTTGWRGQYVQEGCGGLCGSVDVPDLPSVGYGCAPATEGQLVLASDDAGHTSSDQTDGRWGEHDRRAREAFGLTSEHSLAQLAKAVIARYYGRSATHVYFDGCSTGGRQALNLAQRYPDDFDGILAGAPAANLAPLSGMLNPWLIQANTGFDDHQILTAEKLPMLHAAVIDQCGDGDGIITDPRQCAFQPASIQCPAHTDKPTCLTAAQVAAVRKFYRGPTDAAGRSLYNGGLPYGSELGWAATFIAPASDIGAPANTYDGRISLNYLKYLGYAHNPPDGFTLDDVRFTDREFARLNTLGDAIYNANDPDLTAFRDHGGKLIMYHGWADPAIPPWSTIDYYAAVERATGGFAASQRFSRLYLIAGAYHCMIGPNFANPTEIALPELLTPLMDWVERGVAPGSVPAPIISLSELRVMVDQTVQPYDALAPVRSASGSLNGSYSYIGRY